MAELQEEETCLQNRKWLIFFLSSIFTFVIATTLVFLARIFKSLFCKSDPNIEDLDQPTTASKLVYTGRIIPGQSVELLASPLGRKAVVVNFINSMVSLTIFFIDALYNGHAEHCQLWTGNIIFEIDLTLNGYFLVFFIVRFIKSPDKLHFLLELYSFVDYFTIPPLIVSLFLDRTWLGLRFCRALHLISLPLVLHNLSLLKEPISGPVQTASIFICGLLTISGAILVVVKW